MEQLQKTQDKAVPIIRAESATGDLRLHEFRSGIFRNTRFLRVWLPPGYDDAENRDRRYPALYLNDGQNLFEAATSFTGVEWQVDETADRLIRENAIAPMIIVGIDNAGKARVREYMPYRSLSLQSLSLQSLSLQPVVMMMRSRGNCYPDFLLKEVMPFIGRNYRVATGCENTSLGGSSLGALIALYTAMVRPGVVGKLLLESPSLWAANRQIIRESRSVKEWPERVYLGTGTAELGNPDRDRSVVDDVRELHAILRRCGLDERRLRLQIEEGGTHHESAWARRFPEALRFLYGNG
jgi:predicted alpha/beta superfamily hydrolase